jgi:hypothetical protein
MAEGLLSSRSLLALSQPNFFNILMVSLFYFLLYSWQNLYLSKVQTKMPSLTLEMPRVVKQVNLAVAINTLNFNL